MNILIIKTVNPIFTWLMDLYASVTGDVLSDLALIFLVVPTGMMALRFGAAELSALYFLALSLVAVFYTENPGKGSLAGGIGFSLAIIGRDILTGDLRFTFGVRYLEAGFPHFQSILQFIIPNTK